MLPDVGAGNPLTHVWWLALLVLFGATIVAGGITVAMNWWFQRAHDQDTSQNAAILDIQHRFHQCQVSCAEHRSQVVKREDFEARMLRIEDMIVRIHARVDEIALQVGVRTPT